MVARRNLGLLSLRIYGVARTRAFRALWVAEELGVPYQHLPIEIGDAGARTPEFLALNPNGRLPVIVDDGFVLFELLAITLYLAKKYSFGKLYPSMLESEARAWQWSFWAIAEVDRGVNIWSLHAVRLPPDERDAALREEALKIVAAPFKVLDAAVATQPFLLGDDFTVADLNVAAVITVYFAPGQTQGEASCVLRQWRRARSAAISARVWRRPVTTSFSSRAAPISPR